MDLMNLSYIKIYCLLLKVLPGKSLFFFFCGTIIAYSGKTLIYKQNNELNFGNSLHLIAGLYLILFSLLIMILALVNQAAF
mmetsp:Transcript_25054/g.24527  ORF Transcript_25054/g.24527 Transcript_25054/m.24527 type:complete len:81 (+) Transcript_25054:211-453(+)